MPSKEYEKWRQEKGCRTSHGVESYFECVDQVIAALRARKMWPEYGTRLPGTDAQYATASDVVEVAKGIVYRAGMRVPDLDRPAGEL
jgi:hypothetical protein